MKIIDTTDLINWSGTRYAQGKLPELIKDLIRATCDSITSIRFPDGDAISLPGYDGVLVTCEEDNEFIPEGLSVWELKTSSKITTEANKDYNKRTNSDIPDKDRATFVFVTPRRWENAENWANEKKEDGVWKDVKVIEGVQIKDWLETAPPVALQFAKDLSKIPDGVFLLEDEWNQIRYRSDPPVIETLVTAGRDNAVTELISRLDDEPQPVVIQGDSPQEAIAFAIASLLQIEDEETKKYLISKTLIASNQDTARALQNSKPLIIIIQNDQISSRALSAQGHHVIVPKGTSAHKLANPIKLIKPDSDIFGTELEKMEFDHDEARKAAKICARSVTVFQALYTPVGVERPAWADSDEKVQKLIPAMLAGRWDSNNQHDKEVLCKLYGCNSYEEVEAKVHSFLNEDDAPLQKKKNVWTLTAPAYAFTVLARDIPESQLKLYKDAIVTVLGEYDPYIDLPPDKRPYASLEGAKLKHSEWIRTGLSETLLLISQIGDSSNLHCPSVTAQDYANEIIVSIPNFESWEMVASLRDQYSILIEATPDPLLEALENLLEGKPNGFAPLTIESESFIGSHTLHTGILWGLETIAWDPAYLKRAVLILARLTNSDPGGKLMNRPLNSLKEIFLCWHPGTNAVLEERLEALDLVVKATPELAWELIEGLLPDKTRTSSGTSSPTWREAGKDKKESLTYGIVWKAEEHVVGIALRLVENYPTRWREILWSYQRFPEKLQEKAIKQLENLANTETDESVKQALWATVRDFVYRHLSFQDSKWSMEKDALTPFEKIMEKLEPENLIFKYSWLFDEPHPDLPDIDKMDFDELDKKAKGLRNKAVTEIINTHGASGIIELSKNTKLPGLVGEATVNYYDKVDDLIELIAMSVEDWPETSHFIACISAQAFSKFSDNWSSVITEKVKSVSEWGADIKAHMFLLWPDTKTTWGILDELGEDVADYYWSHLRIFILQGSKEDKIFQIQKLLKVGRSRDVFDAIARRNEDIPPTLLIDIGNMVIKTLSTIEDENEFKQACPSNTRDFIESLQSRDDIEEKDKASIEYAYLPLIGFFHGIDLTLYDMLSKSPSLFVDVLCDVYKAHSEKDKPATRDVQNRALHGHRLLQGWHKVPGLDTEGNIDKEFLLSWIKEVVDLCEKKDRKEIGEQSIGTVLAHAPNDHLDKAWPHRMVRDVIEEIGSEEIEVGVMVERHNMRGTVSKAMFEGGQQERELAAKYKEWADKCIEWPRMHKLLNKISESWETNAKKEDIRAEQDKLKYA